MSGGDASRWREAGHSDYRDAAPDDPEARDALRPILRAGRLSRFRLLDIACPKGHRLAQVIRTPVGPVIVGVGPITAVSVQAKEHGVVLEGTFFPNEYDGFWYDSEDGATYEEWPEEKRERIERGNRQEQVCCRLDLVVPSNGAAADAVTVSCRCRTRTIDPTWLVATLTARTHRAVLP